MCMICVCLQVYGSAGPQTHRCSRRALSLGKGRVLAGARTTAAHNEYVHDVSMQPRTSAGIQLPDKSPGKPGADPCGNQARQHKRARKKPSLVFFGASLTLILLHDKKFTAGNV